MNDGMILMSTNKLDWVSDTYQIKASIDIDSLANQSHEGLHVVLPSHLQNLHSLHHRDGLIVASPPSAARSAGKGERENKEVARRSKNKEDILGITTASVTFPPRRRIPIPQQP